MNLRPLVPHTSALPSCATPRNTCRAAHEDNTFPAEKKSRRGKIEQPARIAATGQRWYNFAMSLSVHALASGSSGNSTLVRHEHAGAATYLLIDAGLTVRGMEKSLAHCGILPEQLSGMVLTHEHIDHVRAAYTLARKYGVPMIANAATLNCVIQGKKEVPHELLPTGGRIQMGGLTLETFSVPHDAAETVGVNVCSGDHKVSHITDAGCVTPIMREAVKGAHLLVLEANHDVYRLKAGAYPDYLKRRILSDHGHLSNEAAVSLLAEHLLSSGPTAIWLAHLSRENNLPKLAMNYARATLAVETGCPFTLDVISRDRPSLSWSPGSTALQLNLF